MAKKDLLGDFEFKRFDGLNNGIKIPVTNSMRVEEPVVPINAPKKVVPTNEPKKIVPTKAKKEEKKKIVDLPNFDYKGKNVKPMVNVIPTSTPKKVVPTIPKVVPTMPKVVPTMPKVVPTNAPKKQTIVDSDIDLSEYGALKTKDEKVVYLAMRGWSLKTEQRRNALFHYATKYILRKKKRIYLGSVNS